jgi:methionine synthase reductase
MLAEFAKDPLEKSQLMFLSSAQGRAAFNSLIASQRANMVEILKLFPSCMPPLAQVLYALTSLAPRFYSICSSPLHSQGAHVIKFAFGAVEEDLTPGSIPADAPGSRRVVQGVCTSWLEQLCARWLEDDSTGYSSSSALSGTPTSCTAESEMPTASPSSNASRSTRNLNVGTSVKLFFRVSNQMRLPAGTNHPIIMIGPGTGVAPFVGFAQHRRFIKQLQQDQEASVSSGCWRGGLGVSLENMPSDTELKRHGPMTLYFGCRSRDEDFIFREELEELKNDGILTSLKCAFSRESERKVYVQDLMREDGEALATSLLEDGAYVFVCGDGVGMAKGVHSALLEVLQTHGGLSEADAKNELADMMRRGRYVRDVWS